MSKQLTVGQMEAFFKEMGQVLPNGAETPFDLGFNTSDGYGGSRASVSDKVSLQITGDGEQTKVTLTAPGVFLDMVRGPREEFTICAGNTTVQREVGRELGVPTELPNSTGLRVKSALERVLAETFVLD